MANETTASGGYRRILAIIAAVFVGCAIGLGVFGFGYSEMPSYFGSEPATCANCHVMQDYYDAWSHGSHAKVATCNDCHLPHDNVVAKYAVKAEDGLLHGYKFTFGNYPENIQIRDSSRQVVNNACISCHSSITDNMRLIANAAGETVSCTHCHSSIGHDE